MTLICERVKVADIRPLEDEFGNQFVSRDYDLPANKEYVTELAASFGPSGEPDEPVKLIRDGDLFRIKAGNTRVRAMQELGTEECWAVIDDEDTVQSVLETVVRTDKKKKYEDVELSRFVQQLALFGDDKYMSEVASIDVEKAKGIRRGREVAGEKAGMMTLDRLLLVSEFEDDEEAANRIMESKTDRDADWVASDLRREKKKKELRDAFLAKAFQLNIELVEDYDTYAAGLKYIGRCENADDLEADYMAARVENTGIVSKLVSTYYDVYVNFYGEPLDDSEDAEEARAMAEQRRRQEEYEDIATKISDSLFNWVAERLGDDVRDGSCSMKHLNEVCRESALDGSWLIRNAVESFPQVRNEEWSAFRFAYGYKVAEVDIIDDIPVLADDEIGEYYADTFRRDLDWINLHIADGWRPDEFMEEFLEQFEEKIAELEKSDGADGEDDE